MPITGSRAGTPLALYLSINKGFKMKTLFLTTAFIGLLFSTTGFANAEQNTDKVESSLKSRIELMMVELETSKNSPAIETLILTNIVTAYSNSNIKDASLKERLAKAVIRLKPALSKKESSFIDKKLAKIQ